MRKRLTTFALTLISVFVLTACGSSSSANQTYGKYTASDIESAMQQTATSLEGISAKEAKQYEDYYSQDKDDDDAAVEADMFKNWAEYRDQAGDFQSFGDFDISKSGKTITATQIMDYSKRDMRLIYVFNASSMEVTSINVELVYTMGETMQKAGLNVLMGLGTVFCMLIIISLIISLFRFIPKIQAHFSGSQPEEKPSEKKHSAPAPVVEAEAADDTELVAVIAAAISAYTGTSTDDFVVRSIKRRY